jgi:hypothetical protein
MADDKFPDNYKSDTEELGMAPGDEEADNGQLQHNPRLSPPNPTSAPPTMVTNTSATHSPTGNMQGGPFLGDLPVREATHYPPPILQTDLGPSHGQYVEGGTLSVSAGGGQATLPPQGAMAMSEIIPSPHPHDPSRRSSMFTSPTDFPTSAGTGLYPGGWAQATTGPQNPSLYAFTQQHATSHPPPQQPQQHHHQQQQQPPPPTPGQYVTQPPVPMPQYMSSFDGLPRTYDPNHSNIFRGGGNMPPTPMGHAHGFPGYLQHDGRGLPTTGLKLDQNLDRGPIH